jgi:hypothetical protein
LLCNFSRGEVDAYGAAVNDHRRQNLFLAADRKSEFKDEASVRAFEMTLGQPGIADLLGTRLRHVISHWRNRREHEYMEEGEPLVSDDDCICSPFGSYLTKGWGLQPTLAALLFSELN